MGNKRTEELFCSVCGKSSLDDCSFNKKNKMCNRHYLQMKRHGKITSVEYAGRDAITDNEKICYVCGDKNHKKYYRWNHDGEYKNKVLCGKHYNQMLNHNFINDATQSKHIDRERSWTKEEKDSLEQMYKDGLSCEEMSRMLDRTIQAISLMSGKLGLGDKYMRSNNPNFKAIYQDYDWCYERYINRRMSFEEMADEANCSKRVIEKWCGDIHKLNYHTIKNYIKLNDIQRQLIMFSLLGDGHIDKRENQPVFIVSHAENQKDYLFWKYEILNNLCNKEPSYIPEQYKVFDGKDYLCKATYRLCTKIISELKEIRKMNRIDIIEQLNDFGLSIHMLDDGCRSNSNWEICLAEYTQEEIDLYIRLCEERFGLKCYQTNNPIYVTFRADSSRKLDEIIIDNIPKSLDVIKYKILDKVS